MMRGIDQPTFAEVAPLIRDFWEDASIKQTYDQRNLFQIVIFTLSKLVSFMYKQVICLTMSARVTSCMGKEEKIYALFWMMGIPKLSTRLEKSHK